MTKNAQEIADRIDAALAAGTVPWAQPWIGGFQRPRNLKSKKPYRGINVLLLALSPTPGKWWVTYKQATAMGGQVRTGEHGTRIFFWAPWCPQTKGGRVEQCKVPGHTKKDHPMLIRGYTVFNAETQVDGLESKIPVERTVLPDNENALAIGLRLVDRLAEYDLTHADEGMMPDGAWYDRKADRVNLPERDRFPVGRDYYWTALHELTHSTGHENRLARKFGGFGDKDYAREELVAEIGSAMAAFELGFEPDIDRSAAYIDHWRKHLADDPELVMIAAQRASKALDVLFSEGEERHDDED